MKVLVLGAGGMLGHQVFLGLQRRRDLQVYGTVRGDGHHAILDAAAPGTLHHGVDAREPGPVEALVERLAPNVVVNCIGIIKQLPNAEDPLVAIPINSLLPHRLARLCQQRDARLVHISTDCVFSGARGGYTEADAPDPGDVYGRSKLLGEVTATGPAITLRTSLIGPELGTRYGLVEWFRAQRGRTKGFRHAIFSGLTSVEAARVIADYVLPRPELRGLYHLSVDPISKLDLLQLLRDRYDVPVEIDAVDEPRIDRSLDSTRFRTATGYRPPDWKSLVAALP